MMRNEALTRIAGVMAAALLHGAFFYGLVVAQPVPDFHAEQYAAVSHSRAAPRTGTVPGCALT